MRRRRLAGRLLATVLVAGLGTALAPAAEAAPRFSPGAPGIGDPYFPLDGNGGYDVLHYDLDVAYAPDTDALAGVASLRARATQNLSRFDLDLEGLTVRSVTVDGRAARFRRDGQELVVTPRKGLRKGREFVVVVRYDGVPEPIQDGLGESGFLHTADGAVVVGQPHVADTWFPVNDHPADTATYTLKVTAPTGLDVVSNGDLVRTKAVAGDRTRWTWRSRDPMASYLLTLAIGSYATRTYEAGGVRYLDAVARALEVPFAGPSSGERFLYSQQADASYKRATREIAVPAGGGSVSFDVTRDTEFGWDFFLVEARTAGGDDWTTLPDTQGHTSQDTGFSCPDGWHALHPFLERYQTVTADGCDPTGTSGQWWAATGPSAGPERWTVDLSAYAGTTVELSFSVVSDRIVQNAGVVLDDVEVSTGAGTTSFEDDAEPLDGWTVPGAPDGSAPNANDWTTTNADDLTTVAEVANASLARQPEILDFLAESFGPYPFRIGGGIVVDIPIGFALETQTRPLYSPLFFTDQQAGDSVVVHELAHQWFGDDLTLQRWQHIWLNEGFATYAEWLWAEREGIATPQEIFDSFAAIPADEPFWSVVIGDPGPDLLFDGAVYNRGAMTLHALRQEIGDETFLRLLRTWAKKNSGEHVTVPQFIALAEKVSGRDLDAFFTTWLFTGAKPAGIEPAPVTTTLSSAAAARTGAPAASVAVPRFGDRLVGR